MTIQQRFKWDPELMREYEESLQALNPKGMRLVRKRFLSRAADLTRDTARTEYLRGPRPLRLGVDTGNLIRSVQADTSGSPNYAEVGTSTIYGRAWELGLVNKAGGGKWPARKWLEPTVDDLIEGDDYEDLFIDELERAIR